MNKTNTNKGGLLKHNAPTLDEWESCFYEKGEEEFDDLTPSEIWMRSVENAGTKVAEFIRREEYMKAIESLGDALGLLCVFTKKFREKHELSLLSEIVWKKYPGMCYGCAMKVPKQEITTRDYIPCQCLGMQGKHEDESRLEIAREHKRKPNDIDDWSKMIKALYKGAHSVLSISAICLHFIEEIGEVTRELCILEDMKKLEVKKEKMEERIKKLEDEVADAFSWILGLINKIDQLFEKARDYYDKDTRLPPIRTSDIIIESLRSFPRKINAPL